MRIPLDWLKEYVDYGHRSAEQVAELFSSSGTEVEQVDHAEFDPDIVVAEITSIRPHPNADKLQLASVSFGRRRLEVVCGATNIEVGQKVPLALPGTTIQGRVLEAATIRGVQSEGMLLSARELGIADDHSGIVILPETAKTGQSVGAVLGQRSAVIELARIAANRPDKFGLIGLARELSAVLRVRHDGGKLKLPAASVMEAGERSGLKVLVEDPRDCSAYLLREAVLGGTVSTPAWMAGRLEAAGLRSRSLAVDVTNYVMWETAQPLHAFDADLVRGTIRVRRAKKDEQIQTLDGMERRLSPEILVIADDEGPIAIAGVMGGSRTEVSPRTERIIIESAHFDKTVVRKGALSLGLRTDASTRFEKGLPATAAEPALDRAASLLVQLGGAVVAKGIVGVKSKTGRAHQITLEDDVRRIGGLELTAAETAKVLRAVGCEVSAGKTTHVTIPEWRGDLRLPEDVVEEVLRLVGYDRIPTRLPASSSSQLRDTVLQLRREIQAILTGVGAFEVKTYSFVSTRMIERLGLEPSSHLKLENPKSPEQEYLRSELVSRLLEVLAANRGYRVKEPVIWELAHVFKKKAESSEIAVMTIGEAALSRMKGVAELIGARLHLGWEIQPSDEVESWWHPGRVGDLVLGEQRIGRLGELHPKVASAWKLKDRVAVLQLDWEDLLGAAVASERGFRPLPRFPQTRRDLSFDVPRGVIFAEVRACAEEASRFVVSVDAPEGSNSNAPGLRKGWKNLLFSLSISAPDRTLSGEEIAEAEGAVKRELKRQFKAQIRE